MSEAALVVRFVGDDQTGYEIQLENNSEMPDGAAAHLLREAADKLDAEDSKQNRARGMW